MTFGQAQAFLDQNLLAGETLERADVVDYVEHHAGGLLVLGGYRDDDSGHYVKMHDSWGDEGTVIVHEYDPDDWEGFERVNHFRNGREALDFFLELTGLSDL